MKESSISMIIKGLIVGGTMIIPGVSGGTMAMILGIYDKLIFAVSSFRKAPRQNISLLIKFAVGGGVGLLLFSAPLSWLLENFELPVIYFFMGAVFGGIPLIEKKSRIKKFSFKAVLCMLAGAVIVLMISVIPEGIFQINGSLLSLLLVGGIASVALVLPGISVSHLFLLLGIYEEILDAVKTLDILTLLPLAAGVGIGIVLFSKFLERMMRKYPQQTYLTILGFILGSVAGIFPGIPGGTEFIVCIGLFVLGFLVVYEMQSRFAE